MSRHYSWPHIPHKTTLSAKNNMLSLLLWHAAETRILAELSQVTEPAKLIEMAQYFPFNMVGVFLVRFLV